jgi:3'-5' exoribonuclease
MMIKDFKENAHIKEQLLVISCTKGVTATGARYLNITFQDASKQIEGRKWDASDYDVEVFEPGAIVEVEAEVINYRNDLQLKVTKGRAMDDNVDPSNFVTSAPIAKDVLQAKFLSYLDGIKDVEIHSIVQEIVNENFISLFNYPAAVKNHHEYVSGLAHHTTTMLDIAKVVCDIYPDLDREILYAGVILHDIGKIQELSGPIIPKFTLKGKLVGHISLMQAKISEVANKFNIKSEVPVLLQHMVLSHHGKLEFGSPVLPQTKEAEVLSLIDNLDARLNSINKALSLIGEGDITPKIYSLDERSFYKPISRNKK